MGDCCPSPAALPANLPDFPARRPPLPPPTCTPTDSAPGGATGARRWPDAPGAGRAVCQGQGSRRTPVRVGGAACMVSSAGDREDADFHPASSCAPPPSPPTTGCPSRAFCACWPSLPARSSCRWRRLLARWRRCRWASGSTSEQQRLLPASASLGQSLRRLLTCCLPLPPTHQGPAAHGATTPEAVRLHDDRSTYTGEAGAPEKGWAPSCFCMSACLPACMPGCQSSHSATSTPPHPSPPGVYARGGMSVIDDKSEVSAVGCSWFAQPGSLLQ